MKPEEMTREQLLEYVQRLKEKDKERWKKWYRSPKGEAYNQRQKERKALKS